MKKILKHFFIAIFLIGILTLPYFVFAGPDPLGGMTDVAVSGGYETTDVDETTFATFLGVAIKTFLGLLGIIFIVLIIWAGYNWMTASGNEEKVTKAKSTLYRAIIGLVITLSAYGIWRFIYFRLIY